MSASTLPLLDEPKAGRLTIQYSPTADTGVTENPPRFMWIPVVDDDARYVLRLSTDPAFPKGKTQQFTDLPLNFFTPDATLGPADYHWSYATWDGDAVTSTWSTLRSFTITEGLAETPLPSRDERLNNVAMDHPRLWMTNDRLGDFMNAVKADPDHCTWSTFYDKSVAPWMDRDIIREPAGYPNHQRTAPIWRQTYIDLQEVWYAIRHLAIGGKVTGDAAMTARAKEWLLEAASWDPMGVTSRAYTDEWAYRVCNALAWGYDWLYDELSEDERTTVRAALLERTRDIAEHAILSAKIHLFPYDSHAVRSVSLVIVPACIALLGDDKDDDARDWLNYSIEFLSTVYSPWGDSDGGWAEGTHYWMMGIAYLIDSANRLKSYMGLDLYKRPFFQNTGDFPLYCKAPNTRRATMGDDSTMGDLPCVKTGLNLRQFAGAHRQWRVSVVLRTKTCAPIRERKWRFTTGVGGTRISTSLCSKRISPWCLQPHLKAAYAISKASGGLACNTRWTTPTAMCISCSSRRSSGQSATATAIKTLSACRPLAKIWRSSRGITSPSTLACTALGADRRDPKTRS